MYIMHADLVCFPARRTGTQNSSPVEINYETRNNNPPSPLEMCNIYICKEMVFVHFGLQGLFIAVNEI